jgi:tRNA modification GTPase
MGDGMEGLTLSASDTIAAVSTADGLSPRAIVRLSGPEAIEIVAGILAPDSTLPCFNYGAAPANLLIGGLRIPATLYLMGAPRSYTREDVVELHIPGAPPLIAATVEALVQAGARPADPGEFTRRAFLNGRIDLAQAEAVQTLVQARGNAEYRAAHANLSGHLSRKTSAIRNALADLMAQVEVSLDFGDQDVEIISFGQVLDRLRPIRDQLHNLLRGSSAGRVDAHAVRVILFGPPNAGKSSLFNAIVHRSQAIVSPEPGTTRDTLEATVTHESIRFTIVDTAGLHPSDDPVENVAISRSEESLARADISLAVFDASLAMDADTHGVIKAIDAPRCIVLLNKSDVAAPQADLMAALPEEVDRLRISAITGKGIPELLHKLAQRVQYGSVHREPGEVMVNVRQAGLIQQAVASLERVINDEDAGHPPPMDLVASDLSDALRALSEMTGSEVTEDILDRLFAHFCIGK